MKTWRLPDFGGAPSVVAMPSARALRAKLLLLAAVVWATSTSAVCQSRVVGWGAIQFDGDWNSETFVEVAAGQNHTLARRADGAAVAWGSNLSFKSVVPLLPPGGAYIQLSGGVDHTVALHSDGSVTAWGNSLHGQCNVPALPPCVEVAAGGHHTLARRGDGVIVAWGWSYYGQCDVPALPPGLTYVEMAASLGHNLARRSDGSVVAWGAMPAGRHVGHVQRPVRARLRQLPRDPDRQSRARRRCLGRHAGLVPRSAEPWIGQPDRRDGFQSGTLM